LALLDEAIDSLELSLLDVPVVCGKVTGSSQNYPYIETHMTVQMDEPIASTKIKDRIREKKQRRAEIVKEMQEVEQFIYAIPKGEIREIYGMLYLGGKSQKDIGYITGYTQGRISQMVKDYLKD
jgi:DNA-directed RNA polymerase specialized sigma subunit